MACGARSRDPFLQVVVLASVPPSPLAISVSIIVLVLVYPLWRIEFHDRWVWKLYESIVVIIAIETCLRRRVNRVCGLDCFGLVSPLGFHLKHWYAALLLTAVVLFWKVTRNARCWMEENGQPLWYLVCPAQKRRPRDTKIYTWIKGWRDFENKEAMLPSHHSLQN